MNKSNYLECISCGKSYKISDISDTDFCDDCIDKFAESYDKEYETDVIILTNPSGRTHPVYVE